MLFDASNLRRDNNVQLARQVKAWVAETLHTNEETTLLVTEMRCTTLDCPPIKTVIAVMAAEQPTRHYKIHKPLVDITPEDISALTTVQPKIVGAVEGSHEKETYS